ncbi:MAG: response regulator transcription factor [Actinomycetota bacterium]|nr:response regulator transcription factor [Actinomycetota bacterium]
MATPAPLLRAFEAGADHYMGRPVPYLELRARVSACARRNEGWHERRRLSVGPLIVDHDERRARFGGQLIELTRMEFAFLTHLAGSPSRVFTKYELLREVWGYQSEGRTRTVDAHACRLRRKLEAAGAREHVVNVRGVGYRLLERVSDSLRDGGEATVVSIERAHLAA